VFREVRHPVLIKIVLGNCLLQRAEEKEVGLKGQQF
jgi:hypothetical protein